MRDLLREGHLYTSTRAGAHVHPIMLFNLCSMIRHQRGVVSDPDSTLYEQRMRQEDADRVKRDKRDRLTSEVLRFATRPCQNRGY